MKRLLPGLAVALLLLLVPAQLPAQVLDNFLESFAAAVNGTWSTPLRQYGLSIWYYLAALQLAWSGLAYMLAGPVVRNQMAGRLMVQVMLICASLMLINQLPKWIGGLVFDSFMQMGVNISGDMMSPSAVVGYGAEFSALIMGGIQELGLLDLPSVGFYITLISIGVYGSFLVIAAVLTVTHIMVYVVLGLGGFVIAFGANQWTAKIAENYLALAFQTGLMLLLLSLMVAVAGPMIFEWRYVIQQGWTLNMTPVLGVAGGVFCFAVAVLIIPFRVSSALTAGLDFGWTSAMRS